MDKKRQTIVISYLSNFESEFHQVDERQEIVQDIANVLAKHNLHYVLVDDEELLKEKENKRK